MKIVYRTLFGKLKLVSPRLYDCPCQESGRQAFPITLASFDKLELLVTQFALDALRRPVQERRRLQQNPLKARRGSAACSQGPRLTSVRRTSASTRGLQQNRAGAVARYLSQTLVQ
jgi:hypothetical protein